ncbi:MAG TPA: 2-oxo acid dehydrogenase subunit E2 [Anaerolineae bacterium]|nr:2-oxo acid dehydrogenase subunit E2 [Anaerolineae bacterium]
MSESYQVLPYPRLRRLVQDAGWMARRRHMIHGLLEVDVTRPRQVLRAIKGSTGESLSFTAFVLACLGQAVEQDKRVHAIRNWRDQLIVFDDVDVMLTIEIDVGSEKFPLVHTLRGINRRTALDMHGEIRAIQASPASSVAARGALMRWFYLLPGVARHLLYRIALRSPHLWKQTAGTVGFTSVGMFGASGGWGLGMPNHSLAVTLGGITLKPSVVDGRIEVREFLSLTLSFDHDIVDGAPAARFARRFMQLVEQAYGLDAP